MGKARLKHNFVDSDTLYAIKDLSNRYLVSFWSGKVWSPTPESAAYYTREQVIPMLKHLRDRNFKVTFEEVRS